MSTLGVPRYFQPEAETSIQTDATNLQQIWEETTSVPILNKLSEVLHKRWPDKRDKCLRVLHEDWNFREDLIIEIGLLLKGNRIIIPTNFGQEMLKIIHQGQLEQEECLLKARTSIYWPAASKDIINTVTPAKDIRTSKYPLRRLS